MVYQLLAQSSRNRQLFNASLANKRYQAHLAGFSLPKGRNRYNQTGLMSLMAPIGMVNHNGNEVQLTIQVGEPKKCKSSGQVVGQC